jgi:hypothetical protein
MGFFGHAYAAATTDIDAVVAGEIESGGLQIARVLIRSHDIAVCAEQHSGGRIAMEQIAVYWLTKILK